MTKLNYSFTDVELLNTALTHSSFVRGDNRIYPNNERMEFLGDAVLELCASEYLYLNYPKMNEGMMTRTRARTVCESALNIVAKELELGKYLLLSHGEENTGGREKPSILSDALEAVIGSIFLDGGIECAKRFILSFIKNSVEEAARSLSAKDYKTLLQEYVQHYHSGELEYKVIDSFAAQRTCILLTQNKAKSVRNVAFSATVGTQNTRNSVFENQFGFFCKRFEPADFKLCKLHLKDSLSKMANRMSRSEKL